MSGDREAKKPVLRVIDGGVDSASTNDDMALPGARGAIPAYAELHCRSSFSFLTGASMPEELVERAAALRYAALAITDECSLSGVVHAHEKAVESGLPLIIGTEMRLEPSVGGVPMRLVLLATTRRELNRLVAKYAPAAAAH
mgnify:CR=1 FL=1